MKKGQVTIFIIIGLLILLIIGLTLYFSSRETRQELEIVKPRLTEVPAKIEPVRQAVQSCIERLGKDALIRAGTHGGYVDDSELQSNPFIPTEGNSAELSPPTGPKAAYWWYMKSKNKCTVNCEFASKRPPLKREEGGRNIELQVDDFVNKNLPACVETLELPGCTLQQLDTPRIQSHMTDSIVYFDGTFPLNVVCEDQTARIDDYYAEHFVRMKRMYDLATNITNYEINHGMLEQATLNILAAYSGLDENLLPPSRGIEFSGPSIGKFWIKFEVKEKLKTHIAANIPLLQVFGAGNYAPILPNRMVRDSEMFQIVYNRQFLIALNDTYPEIDARFAYLPDWEPYFDLYCNGELCRADSGSNFFLIPFTINRYEFPYDLSYPVLVELRDPLAFNGEGYVFHFFLEQNMRDSKPFKSDTVLSTSTEGGEVPSIFCNPEQRTSGAVQLYIKDVETFRGVSDASISYVCGASNCNIGKTDSRGIFVSRLPRCINGNIVAAKMDYSTAIELVDSSSDDSQNLSLTMMPIKNVVMRVKNYELLKPTKYNDWQYVPARGTTTPKAYQETIVVMQKQTVEGEQPFSSVAKIDGSGGTMTQIMPGKYDVQIISMLRTNLTIPVDHRCESFSKMGVKEDKECYDVPEEPILFSEKKPFPAGTVSFEYEFTPEKLRGATHIEFRQFMVGLDTVKEENRIAEDMAGLEKVEFYSQSSKNLLEPVIS